MAAGDQATVRELIDALTDAAGQLREGLDAVVEFGICDGTNLQLIDQVDVDFWVFVQTRGKVPVPDHGSVLIRGHWHPGKSPGKVRRGAAADADQELRELTEGDQGGS